MIYDGIPQINMKYQRGPPKRVFNLILVFNVHMLFTLYCYGNLTLKCHYMLHTRKQEWVTFSLYQPAKCMYILQICVLWFCSFSCLALCIALH
jgi:hypothetical protein